MTPIVVVTTPPVAFVSLVEAKAQMRVTFVDDDTLIESYIAAACAHVDGPAAIYGRAIGEQQLEARFDHFGGCPLWLPLPLVQSVESVKYIDTSGVEQTVFAATYRLLGLGTDKVGVDLAYGATWPSTRDEQEAVRVAYTAGYEEVPIPLKQAVLLLVAQWYQTREAVIIGDIVNELPNGFAALMAPYRVY